MRAVDKQDKDFTDYFEKWTYQEFRSLHGSFVRGEISAELIEKCLSFGEIVEDTGFLSERYRQLYDDLSGFYFSFDNMYPTIFYQDFPQSITDFVEGSGRN